jgi:hypothetical protein
MQLRLYKKELKQRRQCAATRIIMSRYYFPYFYI